MLWNIEGTRLQILGSIHVSDRPLVLSDPTIQALHNADAIVFEANFAVPPDLGFTRYAAGHALREDIPVPLLECTKRLWVEYGFEDGELERLKPWWVALLLTNAAMAREGFAGAEGIDSKVFHFAQTHGKQALFLESVEAGLGAFAQAPQNEQQVFLSRIVQHTQEELDELASLVNAWQSANPDNLLPAVDRVLRLMPQTYAAALAGRNRAWMPQLLRLAQSGKNAVAVVGAMHMVGPDSIPSLLAAADLKSACSTPSSPRHTR